MKTRIMVFFITLFMLFSSCAKALTEQEKLKIFYKNEWLFFFSRANGVIEKTAAEKDEHEEKPYTLPVLAIDEINKEYRKIITEYLNLFIAFIDENNFKLKEFYNIIDSKGPKDKARLDSVYKYLTEKLNNDLLPKLRNGIRCMLAIKGIQYIEVAKEIDKKKFASTVYKENPIDTVYWFRFLQHPTLMGVKREDILDSQGVIKYHEFFYESNLKIRIIKQIRDENGNYYGELYADYYKLDQFDKLFDEKGNPRKLNK